MQDIVFAVGIGKYKAGTLEAGELLLSTAVSGASAVAERLVLLNPTSKSIKILQETATKENILKELELLSSMDVGTLTFYFSGHARPAGFVVNPANEKLDDTVLSINELASALSRVNAREYLVILDCCASGMVGEGIFRILGAQSLVIASTTGNQLSWENKKMDRSYFCDALLAALARFSVPLTKEDFLETGEKIKAQVSERVYLETSGKEQIPITFGQLNSTGTPAYNPAALSIIQIVKKRIRSIAASIVVFVLAAGIFSAFFFYRIGIDANQRVEILYGPKSLGFITDLLMPARAQTPFILSNFNQDSRQFIIEQSLGGVWGNKSQSGNHQWWSILTEELRKNNQSSFSFDTYVGDLSEFYDDENITNRLVPTFIFHFAEKNGMSEQDMEARFRLSPQNYKEQVEPALKSLARLSQAKCGDDFEYPPNIDFVELPHATARRSNILFNVALTTDFITDEHIFDSLFTAQGFSLVNYGFTTNSQFSLPYEYGMGFFSLPLALTYRAQVRGEALPYETIDEQLSILSLNSEQCALTANILKATMGLGDDEELEASFWSIYERIKENQLRRVELTSHLNSGSDSEEIFRIKQQEGLFPGAHGNFDPIFGVAFLIRNERINLLPDYKESWDQMLEGTRALVSSNYSDPILDYDDDNRLQTLAYEGRLPPFVLEAILEQAGKYFEGLGNMDPDFFHPDLYDLNQSDLTSWSQWMSMAAPQTPYFDQVSRDAFIRQLQIVERLKSRFKELGQVGYWVDFVNQSEYLLDHFWSFASLNGDIPEDVALRFRNWAPTNLMQTYRPLNGSGVSNFRFVPTGSRLMALARYALRHPLEKTELENLIAASSEYYQGRLERPATPQGGVEGRLINDIEMNGAIIGIAIAKQLWGELDSSRLAQALVNGLEGSKDYIFEDQILTSAWNSWLQVYPTDQRLMIAENLFKYWVQADDTYIKYQMGIALARLYISMGADYGPEIDVIRNDLRLQPIQIKL
jgi:hypothetical protein